MFKQKKKTQKGAPRWMTTFSDLMTLILVFFILLFAFSEIDANKFRMIANSFKGVLDYESSLIPYEEPISSPIKNEPNQPKDLENDKELDNENKQLDELLSKIRSYLSEHDLEDVIMATRENRGVVLVLQENVLFDSGKADLKKQAIPFLNKVADLIKTLPNYIEVEGHTDSQRIIQPSPYASNWNLSGDRAANVINFFIRQHSLPRERFKISGYADIQPIASNETDDGRHQNRRVVIIILDN